MAGRIPQEFINDLVDRTDIVELISTRIQLKKAGREYKACCPFHGEKTPSFTVSPDKGFYHCFGCGAHGTAIGFLMEHDRLEFIEAVEELAEFHSVEVPRDEGRINVSPTQPLIDLLGSAANLYRSQLRSTPSAIDYLKRRGLDGDTAARYMIGFAPPGWDFLLKELGGSRANNERLLEAGLTLKNEAGRTYDRFRDRIMFPIRDTRGRVVGFGGRVTDAGEPKYLNSPETPVFHKGRELYGLFECRQAERNPQRLLVVEGYMDVVALARHGINNAVATLGTATTPDHLQRLFRVAPEIVFCFDGDRAGRDAAWRALQNTLPELREGRQVRFLFLADGEDPDSVVGAQGAAAFNELLEQSQPLSEYLIAQLKAETDVTSLDGQARLAELAKPLLQRLPEGVYRDLLLERLAQEVGLSSQRLAELLRTGVSSASRAPRSPRLAPASAPPRLSLVRKAVRLLLHKPAAAADIALPQGLDELPNPGIVLLTDMLAAAQERPGIRSARLAEEFATHPDGGEHLETLLTQEVPLADGADWGAELQQTLDAILRQELERRFTVLTEKAAQGLTDTEKAEFRALQSQLH